MWFRYETTSSDESSSDDSSSSGSEDEEDEEDEDEEKDYGGKKDEYKEVRGRRIGEEFQNEGAEDVDKEEEEGSENEKRERLVIKRLVNPRGDDTDLPKESLKKFSSLTYFESRQSLKSANICDQMCKFLFLFCGLIQFNNFSRFMSFNFYNILVADMLDLRCLGL